MAASALDSYLVGNKVAVKTGIKISISVWGAVFIALLMNFEHPVWAMITGMISFFAPDHAQVLKKCLFQCFSTVVGGILGVAVMNVAGQSPMLAALSVAAIIFVASALSYHTRDGNVTFCCAIFAVTVCIMVMVTVTLVPTSEEIYVIFVDRVGTVLVGIIWASFISACIWPMFSSDLLRLSSGRLFKSVFTLNTRFGLAPEELQAQMAAVYGGIIEHADLADHCDFEGAWGRRGANVAREMNKRAIEVTTEAYVLHQLEPVQRQQINAELEELEQLVQALMAQPIPAGGDIYRLHSFTLEVRERAERWSHEEGELGMLLLTVANLAEHLKAFAELFSSLMKSEKVSAKGVSIRRHRQLGNCLITGARSAALFLLGFAFWYATDWKYGFLMCVVPIVFSVMLGKLPHPELILKNVTIGLLVGIPVGVVVDSILSGAPSAFELLFLVAAPVTFFGLMGLSSLMSFAYSLGFNLSFMVFLLPENVPGVDIGFSIERSLCMAMGAAALAFLFVWLPRKRVLKNTARVSEVFEHDLERFLIDSSVERTSSVVLAERIGLVIDKMVYVAMSEAPEKKPQLIEEAGKVIFLMSQVRHISAFATSNALSTSGAKELAGWRAELLANYKSDTRVQDRELVAALDQGLKAADATARGQWAHYLAAMDQLTRRVFAHNV